MPRQVIPAVVLLASGLLLVSLFLNWYDPGTDAWSAFELFDLVLAGLALFALSAAGPALVRGRWPAQGRGLPGIGAAASLIVLTQIVNPPPAIPGDAGPRIGAWLALVGSLILAGGGVLAARAQAAESRRERPSVSASQRRRDHEAS
jgi:peptidoglycan/LPS O-acetylase OafA/YrhL